MTEKNGSGKAEDAKFDGVVDELRNVLSGLNRPASESAPTAQPDPFNEPLSGFDQTSSPFSEPFSDPVPSSGEATDQNSSTPDSSETLATDADFWNGNVLGWPSNSGADLPDVPVVNRAPETTQPAPLDNGFLREEPDNFFGSIGEPSPEPAVPSKFQEPEQPKIFMPIEPESGAPLAPEPWAVHPAADDLIPAVPAAPVSSPEASPPPERPAVVPSADPWLHPSPDMNISLEVPPPAPRQEKAPAPFIPGEPIFETPPIPEALVSPPPPPLPKETSVSAEPAMEFELPIPGTRETREKPEARSMGSSLDLEGSELKPADLVQVACIFPEGQEKVGQSFITRLRESADKLRVPMTIQAVFVSAWTGDKVDPASWGKSASLSGADVMFVLTPRANANLFRDLSAAASQGVKTRTVLLEQTNFPTLYADILVEIRRGR